MTDQELLDAYVRDKDQRAFGEVVGRHMDWVYSCARRLVREEELAKDVAQAVFVLLAVKARGLRGHPQLAGWLFKVTRYSASNAMKQLARRRRHEREAWEMKKQAASGAEEASWEVMWPALDEAVGELSGADRDTVLLRFYQGKSAAQMGQAMGVSEEAAKKRLQRAIEKLRSRLAGKGVTLGAAGLALVLAAKVTEAAPVGLAESAVGLATNTGTATLSSGIAKAAAKAMWWAKAKIAAAIVVAAAAAAGTGYGVARHAMASNEFDSLYEKAPGSAVDLTMKFGANTFAVTSIVRYGSKGEPVAVDNTGKALEVRSLPLDKIAPPTPGEGDVVIVFLQPGVEGYDIDRLRLFNHSTRRRVSDYLVTPVPGLSALRIIAPVGVLPAQLDLWMAACSYDASNKPVSLGTKKDSSVKVGSATVEFVDIRDGRWSFPNGQWGQATQEENTAGHETTIQLKATGNWDVGRYQLAAVMKSGTKYISDFFIDLSNNSMPISSYPIGLAKIDHFELRPLARELPFFFDGVPVPSVDQSGAAPSPIPQSVIVDAGGKSQVKLPCGAIVELAGISYHPSKGKPWWGVDGKAVARPQGAFGGSVSGGDRAREMVGRLVKSAPNASELISQVMPGGSMASMFDGRVSHMAVTLDADSPVNIRLGVPTTPWRTLEEIAVEKLPARVHNFPGFIGAPEQGDAKIFLRSTATNYPRNVRFQLVDREGNLHSWNGASSYNSEKMPPWGMQETVLSYSNLSTEDVRAVRFEMRQEEYAEFKDVAMEPK